MSNKVLLSSGSLSNYGIDRVFEFAHLTGFEGVELIVDARSDTLVPRYLKVLMERHGLTIPVVHAPFAFIDPPGWEKEELPRVRRSVRLAEEVGASLVVLHTPFFTDRSYRCWLEDELLSFQKTTSVILAVENMPCCRKPGGRLGVWLKGPSVLEGGRKSFWRFVPSFLSPPCFPLSDLDRLSCFPHLVLDITHLATGGFDPVAVFDRLRERIVHVHLSNFDGREHLELSQGLIDVGRFLHHLKENGYRGMLSLEVMPEYFPSEDEEYTCSLLKENLNIIRENLA